MKIKESKLEDGSEELKNVALELSNSNTGVYYLLFAVIVVAALFFVLKDINKGFNNYDRDENNYGNNDHLSYNKLKELDLYDEKFNSNSFCSDYTLFEDLETTDV